MTYQKTIWTDQEVENPRTYSVQNNEDGTITLFDAFGQVTELGTPVNAENMNKIEQGIYNNDQNKQTKTSLLTQQGTISGTTNVIISDTEKTTLSDLKNWLNITTSIKDYVGTIYPVGSFYLSTAATCPLQTLGIGTWNKVASNIVIGVNTSVAVKGSGLTLGLQDASNSYGLTSYAGNTSYTNVKTGAYGVNKGTGSIGGSNGANATSIGVTTDSSKSGIVGTLTRTNLAVNVFQRTA